MDDEQQAQPEGRVASVDALRGFAMFWIIGGGSILVCLHDILNNRVTAWIDTQLSHAEWEGLRFLDLIMPLFLFIVGVVMPMSFEKRRSRGDTKKQLHGHVVKRTAILFVLGIIAQGYLLDFELSRLSIFCHTLQAIAAGYLISAVIILNIGFVGQLLATAALLALFWVLMSYVPVPAYGAGVLTPDGNLAIFLDKLLLGRFHDGTANTWILSTITFAGTVMLGALAGHLLCSKNRGIVKVLWLLAAGIVYLVSGLVWGDQFPIIRHLWTSSFVLFSSGVCCLLLAAFYLLIDVLGLRRWAFVFVVIGMNSIAVYMAVALFDFGLIADVFIGGLAKWTGAWHELVRAVASLGVIWLILWWMYRRKSFIKV